eukprot:TRINITY_DN101_c0_g1_i1.p1 TRINITY_DN101_c0_g1~~TRINITY_DN101_c0_g1_i1.p1  ORF type:complete len:367 (-),score=104.41 TRINITY_DN101_c0_g1_i1:729-1829(-)
MPAGTDQGPLPREHGSQRTRSQTVFVPLIEEASSAHVPVSDDTSLDDAERAVQEELYPLLSEKYEISSQELDVGCYFSVEQGNPNPHTIGELKKLGGMIAVRLKATSRRTRKTLAEQLDEKNDALKKKADTLGDLLLVDIAKEKELDRLKGLLKQKDEKIKSATGNLKEKEKLVVSLDKELQDLRGLHEEKETIKQKKIQYDEDMQTVRGMLDWFNTVGKDLKADMAEMKGALNKEKKEREEAVAELNGRLTEAKSELAEAKTELKEAKSELAEAKTELKEAKNELAEAKTELKEAKSELAKVKTELKEAKSEAENARMEFAVKVNELTVKVNELTAKVEERTLKNTVLEVAILGYRSEAKNFLDS